MAQSKSQKHKKNWGEQVSFGVERKLDLGNTNTPVLVAQKIVSDFINLDDIENIRLLEPAVGIGNFYFAVLDKAKSFGIDPFLIAKRFDIVDIDLDAINVVKQKLKNDYGFSDNQINSLPIYNTSLLDFKVDYKYTHIITNPPYLSPKNWSSDEEKRKSMINSWQKIIPQADIKSDLFIYFFHWCHSHLDDNGMSLFLCSDGWLDSHYGQSLRDELTGNDFYLESIISWPWKALFRDDTCPIVTIVRKKENASNYKTKLIIDDRNPLDNSPIYNGGENSYWEENLSNEDMLNWFNEKNRRQRLVLDIPSYNLLNDFVSNYKDEMIKLSEISTVTGFSYSAQELIKEGIMVDSDYNNVDEGSVVYPIFYQTQARVGKPVDYRQYRTTSSLSHKAILVNNKLSDKVKKLGLRKGGVWISQAIDRFPLVFTQDTNENLVEWVGVSKYLHTQLKLINGKDYSHILCAILTSTPVLLMLDRYLKEGTRKTLRVNENGYAKEFKKTDVDNLLIPNILNWSKNIFDEIEIYQNKRGVVSLHRLDEAIKNDDWLKIDSLIMSAMGIDGENQIKLRSLLEKLYWRRMRNVLIYKN